MSRDSINDEKIRKEITYEDRREDEKRVQSNVIKINFALNMVTYHLDKKYLFSIIK